MGKRPILNGSESYVSEMGMSNEHTGAGGALTGCKGMIDVKSHYAQDDQRSTLVHPANFVAAPAEIQDQRNRDRRALERKGVLKPLGIRIRIGKEPLPRVASA
jgi:hypothetical protein